MMISNTLLFKMNKKITNRAYFSTKTASQKQFDNLIDYCQKDLLFKCGNTEESPSRFMFLRRWHLEKKVLN